MDLGPFPGGIDNKSKAHSLKSGSVRNAVNADIDADGRARRRKGMARSYAGVAIKGGFGCAAGQFFIEGTTLKKFNGSSPPDSILTSVLGDYCAYEYLDGIIYFSDGETRALIVDGEAKQWGLPAPSAPVLSGGSGTLGAGKYMAALAWVNADGGQSALSNVSQITISDNSQITFNNLPGIPAGLIENPTSIRLFLSSANGEMLYRVTDITIGATSSYTVTLSTYTKGMEIKWQPMGPPPAGKLIKYYRGRMYVLDPSGLLVWYSQPLNYHLFDLGNDYLIFNTPVTVMEPSGGGIFFADDEKHMFYAGIPEEGFTIDEKLDYGAPFNNGQRLDQDAVTWQTHQGRVTGGPDGSISNNQDDRVAVDVGTSSANIVREDDGQRQFITSIKGASPSTMAASVWITAEVIRRS